MFKYVSESNCTSDDLAKLSGNSRLTRLVVLERQLVGHLVGVLGRILHCLHSGRLLGGGVLKDGNPEVSSQVELVESGVRRVLVGEHLVVQLAELHGLHEAGARHELKLVELVCNSRLELVVHQDDLVGFATSVGDVNSHRHDSRVVHRGSGVSQSDLQDVGEGTSQAGRALLADAVDLVLGAVSAGENLLDLTNNTRVNSTAETLVGSKRHKERVRLGYFGGHLSLHELVRLENHVDGIAAEVLTTSESLGILLELGSRDHLHGLGNLTDVLDGLHTDLERLLTS